MTTAIVTLILVAAFMAGSFNPVTIARKLWAWTNWGVGASPKAMEYSKSKFEEFKASSDKEMTQQGADVKRIGQIYQKKGSRDSEAFLNPLIKEAREKKQQHLDLLEQLRNG